MNRSAVLHIPMSQYAFAAAEDAFVIRLRTAKGDVDKCKLFYGDRACTASPVQFTERGMERKYEDELFDFYEAALMPCPARICYYFELVKGEEKIYYYADAFHEELPDIVMPDGFVVEGRSEYYQYPYICVRRYSACRSGFRRRWFTIFSPTALRTVRAVCPAGPQR